MKKSRISWAEFYYKKQHALRYQYEKCNTYPPYASAAIAGDVLFEEICEVMEEAKRLCEMWDDWSEEECGEWMSQEKINDFKKVATDCVYEGMQVLSVLSKYERDKPKGGVYDGRSLERG